MRRGWKVIAAGTAAEMVRMREMVRWTTAILPLVAQR
jgi:hypothetical protein